MKIGTLIDNHLGPDHRDYFIYLGEKEVVSNYWGDIIDHNKYAIYYSIKAGQIIEEQPYKRFMELYDNSIHIEWEPE